MLYMTIDGYKVRNFMFKVTGKVGMRTFKRWFLSRASSFFFNVFNFHQNTLAIPPKFPWFDCPIHSIEPSLLRIHLQGAENLLQRPYSNTWIGTGSSIGKATFNWKLQSIPLKALILISDMMALRYNMFILSAAYSAWVYASINT